MSRHLEFVDPDLASVITDPAEIRETFDDPHGIKAALIIGDPWDAAAVITGDSRADIVATLRRMADRIEVGP